jgi:hypothetical protein
MGRFGIEPTGRDRTARSRPAWRRWAVTEALGVGRSGHAAPSGRPRVLRSGRVQRADLPTSPPASRVFRDSYGPGGRSRCSSDPPCPQLTQRLPNDRMAAPRKIALISEPDNRHAAIQTRAVADGIRTPQPTHSCCDRYPFGARPPVRTPTDQRRAPSLRPSDAVFSPQGPPRKTKSSLREPRIRYPGPN